MIEFYFNVVIFTAKINNVMGREDDTNFDFYFKDKKSYFRTEKRENMVIM